MQLSLSKTSRLTALLGFLSSAAVGCIITTGSSGKNSTECPDKNSYLSGDKCFCSSGYTWCNPGDDADLNCCVSASSASNVSDGTTDGSATGTDGTVTDGGTTGDSATGTGTTGDPLPTTSEGTTGEPLDCSASASVPRSCDENTENFLCVQADNLECGPEGSKYYVCDSGTWAQNPTGPTGNCISDGFDFAYGCEDNGSFIEFVCGNGPGTACTGNAESCSDDGQDLLFCAYGKLGAYDCLSACMQDGDGEGVTYDFGYCGEQRGEVVCICCDEGEDGCPLGDDR